MRFNQIFILLLSLFLPSLAWAEPDLSAMQSQIQELTLAVKDLKRIVEVQQAEINQLRGTPPVVSAAPVISGKFTPEIGVVADVAMKLDSPKTDTGGSDRVSLRELELVFGSHVDPYSRLDATVAFNEDSTAELEEAYLTRFGLPFETTARIGRFKPRIGKDLALHRDSLDTVDEPLVIQRYFGEEGMSKSGVDVIKLLDFPTPFTQQLTLGILEGGSGDGGTAFGDSKRRPTLYGHLRNYWDIDENTNFDLGMSYAAGHKEDEEAFTVHVLGVDTTLIHHLNPNQDIKLQGEAFYMDRKNSFDVNGQPWGGYALLDFRINPQWGTGLRFDYVELVDNPLENPEDADRGYTGYLTFYQSEFARWRFQYNRLDPAEGKDDNQFLIQGTFAIGDHKHKLQ